MKGMVTIMTVTFYGKVVEYTNGDSTFAPDPGVCLTLRSLIDFLGICYGEDFKLFLLGKDTCIFLINSSGIMLTGGLDSPVNIGDKIEILPFVDAG